MKYLKIVLSVICILVMGMIIVIVINNLNKENTIKFKENYTINIGKELPKIDKFVDEKDINNVKNIMIEWKDIIIEDNKIYYTGIYKGIIKYNNKDYTIKLIVEDKENPTIENIKNIEVYVNEKPDFYKDVEIKDNSKDEISKEIIGNYDISKKGEYNLKYVVTDKSGNKTEKEFKLIVKEKTVTNTNTNSNVNRVVGNSSKGYKIEQKNGIYYVNGILIANKTYSLPSGYNPGGILNIFMTNYNNMKNDAANEGINLRIISGFRSYNTQKTLYNNYVARDGQAEADRYSARAGHSEHQTGLAADINSLEQSWENTKEGKWLNDNCYKYGFIIRYPKGKEGVTGYMFEPWHIRYVGVDIATILYNNGNWITLEEYLGIDSKY